MKFLNKAGILFETDDLDKIDCFKAKGLIELKDEPQPAQDVEIKDDYTIRKVVKRGKKASK